MDDQKDEAKKPFYENIAGKKRRGAKDGAKAGSGGARPRTGGHGSAGNRPGDAGRSGSQSEGRPSDRPSGRPSYAKGDHAGRSDRPARADDRPPRSGDRPAYAKGDHAGRPDRPARPGDRPARAGDRSAYSKGDRPARSDDRSAHPGDRPAKAAPRGPRFTEPTEGVPVFGKLDAASRALLEQFPDIVQSVFPLDSKRFQELPEQIRALSHDLTDERDDLRVGYMNDPATLSAYIRYYQWWNLVRLSRLLANLDLSLSDGDCAVDLGSGPLTLPIALWIARPELRKLKLTWYCVDLSQGALSAGEDIFLALAAKTGDEPWSIVRVRGEFGVSLRRRVALVASANMFNEMYWDNPLPIEAQAKHHAQELASYAAGDAAVLLVEPGVPRSGRFVSLIRDAMLRQGFQVVAPCPHAATCPFPGLRYGKWCHFAFDTADAPAKLHTLSDQAGLAKARAALSFVYLKRTAAALAAAPAAEVAPESAVGLGDESASLTPVAPKAASPSPSAPSESLAMVSRMTARFSTLKVRVTSDPIKLPDYYTGLYGCSEIGMVMLVGTFAAADYLKNCPSGSLLEVPRPSVKSPEIDGKTGATVIRL